MGADCAAVKSSNGSTTGPYFLGSRSAAAWDVVLRSSCQPFSALFWRTRAAFPKFPIAKLEVEPCTVEAERLRWRGGGRAGTGTALRGRSGSWRERSLSWLYSLMLRGSARAQA